MLQTIDDQQFLEFYDQNADKIYQFVFFRVAGRQEAQDLTSEIFLKAWQYVSGGNEVENLRALFYQIARNQLVDHYRLKDKKVVALQDVQASPEQKNLVSDAAAINREIDDNLDLERIKKALKGLKEEYQEVVILRYLNDLDLKEVAEIMDKSYGATRVLVTRALTALKKELERV